MINRQRTDYSKIANRYDANPMRHRIEAEPEIRRLLDASEGVVQILDLACGTGNYIVEQRKTYPTDRILWHGIDLSDAMLDKARRKLPGVDFSNGNAEALPFDGDYFDLVVCRSAFHHFENKRTALNEVARILRPGGILIMRDICPEHMSRSWVYHYFPETKHIDAGRCWDAYTIFDALSELELAVRIDITHTIKSFRYEELIAEAKNRDMSQLNMIGETAYQDGLSRLQQDRLSRPTFSGDFAALIARAEKIGTEPANQ